MITKKEIKGGFSNLGNLIPHPSLLLGFLMKGRVGLIRKVMEISLAQLSKSSESSYESYVREGKGMSLIGNIQGISQEFLYFLVRAYKPKVVVETGVYRGISSALILGGLRDNNLGKLYSIDLPRAKYTSENGTVDFSPLSGREVTGFAIPDDLKSRWELILGDSRVELPKLLDKLGTVDMFYHDSEHTYAMMMWEYKTVFPFLSGNSIISSDDVNWNTAFQDFCRSRKLMANIVAERGGYAIVKRD